MLGYNHCITNQALKLCTKCNVHATYTCCRFVRLGWQAIKATLPLVPGMEDFKKYFEDTWIRGCYSAAVWNVHDSADCRTNNHVEGWHSKLRKVVGKAHPNIFEIVRTFKVEQACVDVALAQMGAGARAPPQCRWTVDKNRRITELKRQFAANHLSLEAYIKGLASLTNLRI